MRTSRFSTVSFTVAAGLLVAACGSSDNGVSQAAATTVASSTTAPAGTSAGDSSSTLRIGITPGWEDTIAPLFAAGTASDGSAVVVVDSQWMADNDGVDVERAIISAVVAGELDLGYVGTRALADAGAPGFAALTAPFAIDSYALQGAVLGSDLPEQLLAGLDGIGVTGIAIGAGPLRRPMGVEHAMVSLDDFEGKTFHTFRSATNAMTIEALGATHTDVYNRERNDGLNDGSIDGVENTLAWAMNNPRARHLTAGVALWPATGALIANPSALDTLSDADRAWLLAVPGEFPSADDHAAAELAFIESLCVRGDRFSPASDADLGGLRDAVAGVYDAIDDDPATASALETIERLRAKVAAEQQPVPAGCDEGEVVETDAADAEGTDDPGVLNGVYVVEWTVEDLTAALLDVGVDEPGLAEENAGVITLTFDDGDFDQVFVTVAGVESSCPGTYGVTGDRVVMVATDDIARWQCGADTLGVVLVDARWELADGALLLSDFQLSEEPDVTWFNALFFGKPLTAQP